jgi:hypothetical protein
MRTLTFLESLSTSAAGGAGHKGEGELAAETAAQLDIVHAMKQKETVSLTIYMPLSSYI